MENNYDFLSMGMKDAVSNLRNLKEQAKKIEAQFGIDAKMEYEVGIAMMIPQYEKFPEQNKVTQKSVEAATTDYGKDGKINSSYLDGAGIQNEYWNSQTSKKM